MKTQKIQFTNAANMLKSLGFKTKGSNPNEIKRLAKNMGFEVASVPNKKYVAASVSQDVADEIDARAEELGVCRDTLIREILYNFVNKKNKVL